MKISKLTGIMIVFLTLIFVTDVSGAPKRKDMNQNSPDILAKIGKKVINKKEFDARIARMPAEFQNRLKTEQQKLVYFDSLVQADLLALEAQSLKIDKEPAIKMRIDDLTNNLLSQEYMQRQLAKLPRITDQEIEKYYNDHKAELVTPPMVKAQHILIRLDSNAKQDEVKAAFNKINGIHKEAVGGAEFGKLAEKYSEDAANKANGGDIGFFTKDRIIPEISNQAFNMKVGEISQPIKTNLGYHIIKVNEKKDPKQLTLTEASPRIRTFMENKRHQEVMKKEIDRLKIKYRVVTYPERIK
ncbi:MAG: peptidylprolyl isomerase [Syntrophales bacterium]